MSSKIYELSDNDFIKLVKSSHNIGEILFKLKLSVTGNTWGYNQVKERMKKLNLSGADLLGREVISKYQKEYQVVKEESILSKNCKHPRCVLRRYIIANNLLPYKCDICGISSWQEKPISLEVDHINGVNNDNRLENLRFLCPNCHSQTPTYGSKNIKIDSQKDTFNITEEQKNDIISLYKKHHNVKEMLKHCNYTVAAIKHVLIAENIYGGLNQKFVIRYNSQHEEIQRWGTINEAVKYLFDLGTFKTTSLKTARNTFLRNYNKFWLDSYWEVKNVHEV